jgi:uncharacterized protein YcbK (DUF882 family)
LAISDRTGLGRIPARLAALLIAASGLSGCVVSALDSTASFAPASEPAFTSTETSSLPVPRPTEDIASADNPQDAIDASETAEGETPLEAAGDTEIAIGEASPQDELLAAGKTEETVTAAADVRGDELADGEFDVATARIDAASAPQPAKQFAVVPPPPPSTAPQAKRPRGLLSLFGNNRPRRPAAPVASSGMSLAEARRAPVVGVAPANAQPRPVIATARATGTAAGLPGYSRERAIGLNQSPDLGPDPDEIDTRSPVRLASAAGLARLAPNGLNIQHDGVDVKCLKPALVRVLKQIERNYGQNVVVTSGYRSPNRNRKARGSKNSLHMYCSAADIQVEGVTKWELASFVRSMPGRGGVGTYCHTNSVHVDIGPQRDWNWRCRRRKR